MTGVSWRPPPAPVAGTALRRPVAGGGGRWGGGPDERLGGGGRADGGRRRRPVMVRIAGSGGRAGLRPAVTGRVANGAGPMKTTGHVKTESTEAVVHLWA